MVYASSLERADEFGSQIEFSKECVFTARVITNNSSTDSRMDELVCPW